MVWSLRGMKFVSIKGAGHEVPRDKRHEAYVLVDQFLKGEHMPYKDEVVE